MKKNKVYPLLLVSILFLSCTNDSTNDLLEETDITNVRYSINIKPIIDNNCISCHAATPINGAPMSLTTYNAVKAYVENGMLVDRISRNQGASGMMPLGGIRLPQQSINLIVEWGNQGFLE